MKKSAPFLLTFLFLAFFSVKAQPPVDAGNAEVNYQTGFRLLQEGRAAEALPFLQAAVKINKESYLYRLNAGRAAQFSGNFQLCAENLTEALRLRPQEQTAQAFHLWRAECYAELGNRAAAQNDLAKAVELQPGLKGAYSTRIFYDTGNVCRGNAAGKYREAEAFYNAGKIYEAYRDSYVALKCDPKHLPSLKLRLKIESADNNLAAHANIHRAQLEKIEREIVSAANKSTPASDEVEDANSDAFLDKVFDVKKDAPVSPKVKPASSRLLEKKLAEIEKTFGGLPIFTRAATPGDAKLGEELYGAVVSGRTELALNLIKRGADVNRQIVTSYGYRKSVLTQVIERDNNFRLVKALLEAGANPNCDLRLKEMCPMAAAISTKNTLVVALLIKHKLDVNGLYNDEGFTYLMAAVANNAGEEMATLLIEAGADESAKNNRGETARQIIERKQKAAAAKVPPTAAELRRYDINQIVLARQGINSLVDRYNKHWQLFKETASVTPKSEKLDSLYKMSEYLNDIVRNATQIEAAAARLLSDPAFDPAARQPLQNVVADVIASKEAAKKNRETLNDAIRQHRDNR